MKRSVLAVFLCVMLVFSPLATAADQQVAGEVKALIPAASRNSQPVSVKDSLAWNDLLQTDTKGRLRAGLTDGSILSLGSNSQLRVVQHDAASQQTSLEMNYGKLRNQVVKITQPSGKYEVKTPNAIIGVIGTDFYVGYANNQTTVICYVGKVAVTPLAGAKVVKSDVAKTGSTDTITLLAGQMVVIGMEPPPGGYQSSTTPPAVAKASMEDTNVNEHLPVTKGSHAVRNGVLAAGVAAAGWAVALVELRSNGGTTCKPSPNNPNCRILPP